MLCCTFSRPSIRDQQRFERHLPCRSNVGTIRWSLWCCCQGQPESGASDDASILSIVDVLVQTQAKIDEIDDANVTPGDFSVMVRGLPADVTKEEVRQVYHTPYITVGMSDVRPVPSL